MRHALYASLLLGSSLVIHTMAAEARGRSHQPNKGLRR